MKYFGNLNKALIMKCETETERLWIHFTKRVHNEKTKEYQVMHHTTAFEMTHYNAQMKNLKKYGLDFLAACGYDTMEVMHDPRIPFKLKDLECHEN